MISTPSEQQNLYKGTPPRCWVRLKFVASDGVTYERELLADTGSPCAVILGEVDLALLSRASAVGIETNFGHLSGGWLEVSMSDFGVTTQIQGYGSEEVFRVVRADCPDFAGLVGLPLLRMFEYGGDAASFWLRQAQS